MFVRELEWVLRVGVDGGNGCLKAKAGEKRGRHANISGAISLEEATINLHCSSVFAADVNGVSHQPLLRPAL